MRTLVLWLMALWLTGPAAIAMAQSPPGGIAGASDIDYYYASRLPGEPADGVEDRHTHPTLPRTLRLSLRYRF